MTTFGQINITNEVKDVATQTPTPAATINLTISAGKNTFVNWTASQNETVNISMGTPNTGDELTLLITNDGILPRVITFGTLLTSIGIVTGVLSKTSTVKFVSNGVNFFEVSRTVGI